VETAHGLKLWHGVSLLRKTGKFHAVVVGCGYFAMNDLKNRNFVILDWGLTELVITIF
jgi:hypothetical protein